jgi:hypothetical protein
MKDVMTMHRIHSQQIAAAAVVCLHLTIMSGCCPVRSKICCPVHVPHDHLLGAEAIRVPPCGPDGAFYGMKKTNWRQWPVGWELCEVSEHDAATARAHPELAGPPSEAGDSLPDVEFGDDSTPMAFE